MLVFSPIQSAVRRSMTGAVAEPFTYRPGIHLDFTRDLHYARSATGLTVTRGFSNIFTFTGGNQSYYMGPNGLLIPSVTNTPRIEYTAAGQPLGLKMEAARTNLGLHSNDGTNVAWTKSNCTAAKTATGPDGVTNSATTLTATAGNATCLQSVTSASATRANAVWLKRRTGTGNIDMTLDGGTGWTTKTITTSWARYEITQAAVTNPNFGLRIVTSGDAVDFWGEQLESAAFASSDIPTTTVGVARTSDSCLRTLGAEFSATAGTVVISGRASPGRDASLAQVAYDIGDGTGNERIFLARVVNTDTARYTVTDGGVSQGPLDNTFVNSTNFKHAAAWAANDLACSFNGAAIQTDTSATLPTVTTMAIGLFAGGGSAMNGHILKFDYWPERKPNEFLVAATT